MVAIFSVNTTEDLEKLLVFLGETSSPLPTILPPSRDLGTPLDIFYEVFGKRQALPEPIVKLIGEYIPEEERTLILDERLPYFDIRNPLSHSLNLGNPHVLVTYLGRDFRHQPILSAATKIAKRIYEQPPRIVSEEHGQTFPMVPEVLAYAMQLARGQTVLEIGGASGENAILLACSDANHVYLNDIHPPEIATFQNLKRELPAEISRKLTALKGDCFNLPLMKPDLLDRVGLILCQNVIHFFKDKQQRDFFDVVKGMLRPGGRAIFTANSIHLIRKEQLEPFASNPQLTIFNTCECFIFDNERGSMPIKAIFRTVSPGNEASIKEYQSLNLYERRRGGKWQVNKEEFRKIEDVTIREKIKEAIQTQKPSFKSIKTGRISVLFNTKRLYSTATLINLFRQHGLNVESAFEISSRGHIIQKIEDTVETVTKVGAIVSRP